MDEFSGIWMDQCEAVRGIRDQWGKRLDTSSERSCWSCPVKLTMSFRTTADETDYAAVASAQRSAITLVP